MSHSYVLAIDQSTQGTKAVLFDERGRLEEKCSRPHRQIIHDNGFVEHDPREIALSVELVMREVIERAGIEPGQVAAIGISNQRETCMAWDCMTGEPLYNAVVWQCSRGKEIADELLATHPEAAGRIRELSGMPLSPYFSAAKYAWLLRNVPAVMDAAEAGTLALGTMDSWVLWSLTGGAAHATEPSNACRTQLFDIRQGCWSEELCELFGVPASALPELRSSDALFGATTCGGLFSNPVPIHGMLGDSQAALLGQGCINPGQVKATYGTGSSVMMQTGSQLVQSGAGLVTSVAWELAGQSCYVLEGNINYTGAVVSWMCNDAHLISEPADAEVCARRANPADRAYFVPAFTGLGAPYWDDAATGLLTGVTRTTGHDEIVRACLECIAYQIGDVVAAMRNDVGRSVSELRVDGGPTANGYLMQFQADVTPAQVSVSSIAELSAAGAAQAAGQGTGLYSPNLISEGIARTTYIPKMDDDLRLSKIQGWQAAVAQARTN